MKHNIGTVLARVKRQGKDTCLVLKTCQPQADLLPGVLSYTCIMSTWEKLMLCAVTKCLLVQLKGLAGASEDVISSLIRAWVTLGWLSLS